MHPIAWGSLPFFSFSTFFLGGKTREGLSLEVQGTPQCSEFFSARPLFFAEQHQPRTTDSIMLHAYLTTLPSSLRISTLNKTMGLGNSQFTNVELTCPLSGATSMIEAVCGVKD